MRLLLSNSAAPTPFAVVVICGEFFMKGLCLLREMKTLFRIQIAASTLLVNNSNHSVWALLTISQRGGKDLPVTLDFAKLKTKTLICNNSLPDNVLCKYTILIKTAQTLLTIIIFALTRL